LADTNGILRLPWVRPERTSAGLGWAGLYVSSQREEPYEATFGAAGSHLLILHRDGPVTVRRGQRATGRSRTIPPGGFFVHPAGKDLTVELGGQLATTHVCLADAALREAHGDDAGAVELAEELGSVDPLLEQLVLSLDSVLCDWQPAARTYVDQLGCLIAAQLAFRHSHRGRHPVAPPPIRGLPGRQFAAVCELLRARLAEPVPLRDMAAAVGLSVSQFARQFKAHCGLSPHRYLVQMRVDAAVRMLRTGSAPIAEVAAACGFSHQEHLTRVLVAHVHSTPAAIRRGA
jgi:AraC family transcriptional regulator